MGFGRRGESVQTGANTARHRKKASRQKKTKKTKLKSAELTTNENFPFGFTFHFSFLSSTRKSHTPANNSEQIITESIPSRDKKKEKRTKQIFVFLELPSVFFFLLTIVVRDSI